MPGLLLVACRSSDPPILPPNKIALGVTANASPLKIPVKAALGLCTRWTWTMSNDICTSAQPCSGLSERRQSYYSHSRNVSPGRLMFAVPDVVLNTSPPWYGWDMSYHTRCMLGMGRESLCVSGILRAVCPAFCNCVAWSLSISGVRESSCLGRQAGRGMRSGDLLGRLRLFASCLKYSEV